MECLDRLKNLVLKPFPASGRSFVGGWRSKLRKGMGLEARPVVEMAQGIAHLLNEVGR